MTLQGGSRRRLAWVFDKKLLMLWPPESTLDLSWMNCVQVPGRRSLRNAVSKSASEVGNGCSGAIVRHCVAVPCCRSDCGSGSFDNQRISDGAGSSAGASSASNRLVIVAPPGVCNVQSECLASV